MTKTVFDFTAAHEKLWILMLALDGVLPWASDIDAGHASAEMAAIAKAEIKTLRIYLMSCDNLVDAFDRIRLMVASINSHLQVEGATEGVGA